MSLIQLRLQCKHFPEGRGCVAIQARCAVGDAEIEPNTVVIRILLEDFFQCGYGLLRLACIQVAHRLGHGISLSLARRRSGCVRFRRLSQCREQQ